MKIENVSKPVVFILFLSLLIIAALPAAAAETYKLDPDHVSIIFQVKFMGTYVYGRISGATGTFLYDERSPAKNAIEFEVNADKVDTAVDKRDKHLRSPDFFNVGKYPLITFKSSSVKKSAKDHYEVSGDLTLLGKTRSITVKAHETGSGKDPWGNFRRGFETSFMVKRSEFGMNFMLGLGGVSDEVRLTVAVSGIRQ